MNRRKKIQHSKNTHRKCVKRMTSERRMLRMLTTSVVSLALIKYNLLVRTYPVWNRQTLYYCENSSEFMSFKNNWNMQINHTKNIAHLNFSLALITFSSFPLLNFFGHDCDENSLLLLFLTQSSSCEVDILTRVFFFVYYFRKVHWKENPYKSQRENHVKLCNWIEPKWKKKKHGINIRLNFVHFADNKTTGLNANNWLIVI